MKKLLFLFAFGLIIQTTASAQWGFAWTRKPVIISSPAPQSVVVEEYYFFPDYEVYYSIPAKQWIYIDGGTWRSARVLPARYSVISLNSSRRVLIDYHGPRPYQYIATHRVKYPPGQLKKMKAHPSQRPNHPNIKGNNGNRGKGKKH